VKTQVERKLASIGALALVGVALYVFGLLTDQFFLRLGVKAFPVLALMAVVWTKGNGRYAKTILFGLGFCLAGDLLLEFRQRFFLFGMVAFAAGHIAYIVSFVRKSKALAPLEALPFAGWIGWVLFMLWPGLGKMLVPVSVYTVVIFGMMWRATAAVDLRPNRWAAVAVLGACFFGFSDTLIALDRFHTPIEGVRIPIILTYWTAQIFIAMSALEPESSGDRLQT